MAEYLYTVSDKKLRSTLTRYRLSGHKLMIETGRHRQTWLPPEQRLCSHCDLNQTETELHFLTECSKYTDIRTVFYNKIQQIHPTFKTLPDQEKTSVSARRTQELLCVCCSICVSLSPQKRRHSTCPELMLPAHLHYIMPYYLNVYFASVYLILYLFNFIFNTYLH